MTQERAAMLPFLPLSNKHRQRIADDRLALLDSKQRVTYGELRSYLDRGVYAFSNEPKNLIFCCVPRSVSGALALLASAQAGHAMAVVDPAMPGLESVVDAYRPRWIWAGNVEFLGYKKIKSSFSDLTLWEREGGETNEIHPDLYLMLLTSGSTGSSKAVRLSYANLIANTHAIIESLDLTGDTCALGHLPLSYSFGLSVLHIQLATGGAVALTEDGLMSPQFWAFARESEATLFPGVPYHYEMMMRLGLDRLNVPMLRMFLQAGGKMSNETTAKMLAETQNRKGQLFVMYGQTEAAPRMSCCNLTLYPEKLGSSGTALAGGKLSTSEDGEIVYQGPNVMMGYAERREDLALGDVMGGRLETGDLGHVDADGFLTITGRKKRFAKLYGKRISLDDVESAAKTVCPSVHVAVETSDRIVLVTSERDEDTHDALKSAIADNFMLSPAWISIHCMDALPHLANGKVDYQKLCAALHERAA